MNRVPPYRRDVNTVFQSYALFPHLDVAANVSFGLRRRKLDREEIRRRVGEALDLVGLTGLERYVAVIVRARAVGLDSSIEKAAADLGAGPWTAFRTVTLPLLAPGIVAAALLAFAMSIDDFIITQFVARQTLTFPLRVYGAVKVGIPPQVFVMGTPIFAAGVLIAIANTVLQRRTTL